MGKQVANFVEVAALSVLLIAVMVALIDQASKLYVQSSMVPNESIPVIRGVLHITYVRNPGAAFGMLAYKTGFFIVATVVVVVLIFLYARQLARDRFLLRLALGLQLGGALGNLIDRLRSAHVVDFLDFRVWPVFNLADVAIVLGVAIFFYDVVVRLAVAGRDA